MKPPDWIAIDWGTSRLRAWAMSSTAEVLARAASDQGISALDARDCEAVLLELIDPWLDAGRGRIPVIGCGMVGSRQGWVEVPYAAVPCRPAIALTGAPVRGDRIDVWICPGIKQEAPADVMRGEETQIAGLLTMEPEFEGIVCLPGTHSKWVRVGAGAILAFQTFLTGELFALLADHSVLRHSIAREGWDDGAFLDALDVGLSSPAMFSAKLFSLRAEALLEGLDGRTARARLSGYLVGLELGAARPFWQGREIVLVGEETLSARYAVALHAQGATTRRHDTDRLTLAGLGAAYLHRNA